jgi:hypothetical protein
VWFVDGEPAVEGTKSWLSLQPGNREIALKVTDAAGNAAVRRRGTLVWQPDQITRVCFAVPVPEAFLLANQGYDKALGFGFVGDFQSRDTSEPRPQFDRGCTCQRIQGTLRLRLKPGRYRLEMGATDWWSTKTGPVRVQGNTLDLAVQLEDKKLTWKYDGYVTVGDEGLLTIVFGDGTKGPALVSYVVTTADHGK